MSLMKFFKFKSKVKHQTKKENSGMKMVNLILIFILSFGIAFSQQFNLFDVFPLGGLKVKYDRYGNPWAVGLSSSSGGNFYLFRSENGRFKSPIFIGKVPNVYNVQYVNWDFDIDTSGVVHIAGVIYEGFRDGYNNPAPFYLNSEMDSAVVFNAVSLGPLNPPNPNHDYIRVLRTTDDKIVANVAIWFPYSSYTRYPDSLIWVQLVNPSANSIRATIDTIYLGDLKSKGEIIVWNLSINKNLFLMTYGWYRIGASSDWSIDTVAYTFAIYRIRPGGRAEMINSAEIVRVNIVDEPKEPAPLPYYIADFNDGANAWLIRWFNVWSPFPRFDGGIVSAEEDREGNLHLVGISAKQYIYQVYTPANRPANEEGKVPTYSYVISYDSTIHWQFKSELIDWYHYIPYLSVSAFNLNKATITFSGWQVYQVGNKWRGVPGKVLLHQESGNYRYEVLAGTSTDEINRLRFGLSTNWYIDNSGQVYLWNDWESIGFDSTRTAYIYLYKLRSTGNSFIMNYSLTNDIKEKMISPIPVGKIPGYAFSDFQYKFDKDKRMYFLVLTIDSLRPATYLGRMFLVKETSPGQWDTTLVSTDTTNVLWFDYYTDFVVDENGNVHVVYATYKGGRSMVFYTNNEGGSFKTPIPVDTTRILRHARIRVSRNGLVYIWGQDLNINRYFYYYGDYVSGFKRSSRDFSDFDKAEVDANGNLYIVSSPWWSSSGYSVYLYKFNRDSALIYRFPNKILFTFQSGSPIVYPSFTFVRDENWQIHLLGVYESKLYHWKSSDNFTARVEYDLSNVLKFRSGSIISAVANDLDKRIYFFTTLSTFEPMIVGWIPYTVTGVEKDGNVLPREFSLSQNYPNPFNPATTISFELPVKSSVEISIYDVLGRKLKTVLEEVKDAGRYKVVVDMSGYASGVYFYRMVAKPVVGGSDFISVRKMLLIK